MGDLQTRYQADFVFRNHRDFDAFVLHQCRIGRNIALELQSARIRGSVRIGGAKSADRQDARRLARRLRGTVLYSRVPVLRSFFVPRRYGCMPHISWPDPRYGGEYCV